MNVCGISCLEEEDNDDSIANFLKFWQCIEEIENYGAGPDNQYLLKKEETKKDNSNDEYVETYMRAINYNENGDEGKNDINTCSITFKYDLYYQAWKDSALIIALNSEFNVIERKIIIKIISFVLAFPYIFLMCLMQDIREKPLELGVLSSVKSFSKFLENIINQQVTLITLKSLYSEIEKNDAIRYLCETIGNRFSREFLGRAEKIIKRIRNDAVGKIDYRNMSLLIVNMVNNMYIKGIQKINIQHNICFPDNNNIKTTNKIKESLNEYSKLSVSSILCQRLFCDDEEGDFFKDTLHDSSKVTTNHYENFFEYVKMRMISRNGVLLKMVSNNNENYRGKSKDNGAPNHIIDSKGLEMIENNSQYKNVKNVIRSKTHGREIQSKEKDGSDNIQDRNINKNINKDIDDNQNIKESDEDENENKNENKHRENESQNKTTNENKNDIEVSDKTMIKNRNKYGNKGNNNARIAAIQILTQISKANGHETNITSDSIKEIVNNAIKMQEENDVTYLLAIMSMIFYIRFTNFNTKSRLIAHIIKTIIILGLFSIIVISKYDASSIIGFIFGWAGVAFSMRDIFNTSFIETAKRRIRLLEIYKELSIDSMNRELTEKAKLEIQEKIDELEKVENPIDILYSNDSRMTRENKNMINTIKKIIENVFYFLSFPIVIILIIGIIYTIKYNKPCVYKDNIYNTSYPFTSNCDTELQTLEWSSFIMMLIFAIIIIIKICKYIIKDEDSSIELILTDPNNLVIIGTTEEMERLEIESMEDATPGCLKKWGLLLMMSNYVTAINIINAILIYDYLNNNTTATTIMIYTLLINFMLGVYIMISRPYKLAPTRIYNENEELGGNRERAQGNQEQLDVKDRLLYSRSSGCRSERESIERNDSISDHDMINGDYGEIEENIYCESDGKRSKLTIVSYAESNNNVVDDNNNVARQTCISDPFGVIHCIRTVHRFCTNRRN